MPQPKSATLDTGQLQKGVSFGTSACVDVECDLLGEKAVASLIST